MRRGRLIGLALLTLAVVAVALWLKGRRGAGDPAPGDATPTAAAGAGFVELEPSERDRVFSAAWRDGALPAPLAAPTDAAPPADNPVVAAALAKRAIDARAEELAGLIAAGDERSLPALVSALIESGFVIVQPDGTTLRATGAAGLQIEAAQLAGAAKLYGRGHTVRLTALEAALKRALPAAKDESLAPMMLDDLRDGLTSGQPSARFFSHLVFELGRVGAEPYDLTNTSLDPDTVRFDAIQTFLILTRLGGEVAVDTPRVAEARRRSHSPVARMAGFAPPAGLFTTLLSPVEAPECQIDSSGSTVFDYGAAAASAVFTHAGNVLKKLQSPLSGRLAKAGVANLILSLAKFFVTFATVDTKLEIDADPLVRTTTTTPGARQTLRATLVTNTGKYLQLVNCVRPLLNIVGIDASVPVNGPLGNVKVTWTILDEGSSFSAFLHNRNIDEDFGDGNRFPSDPIGGVRLLASANNFTDNDGRTTIQMEGVPQTPDVIGKRLVPEMHKVRVVTFFQAKTTNPTTVGDYAGAIGDYLGPSLSLILGDKLGGLAGLFTETAYRISFWPSSPLSVNVKDWVPCGEDGWMGTISMSREFALEDKAPSNWGQGSIVSQKHGRVAVLLRVAPRKGGSTDGTAIVSDSEAGKSTDSGVKVCRGENGNDMVPFEFVKSTTANARGTVSASVKITVTGDRVSFRADTDSLDKLFVITDKSTDACDPRNNKSRTVQQALTKRYGFAVDGKADPATPYDLTGTQTEANGPETTKYTWDLHQCVTRGR